MKKKPALDPGPGSLLVAVPHLVDPNFRNAVVLLCNHTQKGAFGFVLNRPAGKTLDEVLPVPHHFPGRTDPVYVGGPVGLDSMTILHHEADLPGVQEVLPGVFLGGTVEDLARRVAIRKTAVKDLRFLVGYSGWGEGQLLSEIHENTWVSRPGRPDWVFDGDPTTLWQRVLRSMRGGVFDHFPSDPMQN